MNSIDYDELNAVFLSETDFYRKHLPIAKFVIGYILYGVGTEQDVEECANDTLCEIMQNPYKYDPSRGSITNYVRIIARSRALNLRRKLSCHNYIPLDESILVENAEDHYIGDIISSIIASLKPSEKVLFTLKFIYCYPSSQIAVQLGTSQNNTDVRINRLRKKLKAMLQEHGIAIKEV